MNRVLWGKSRCWLTPGTKQAKDKREVFVQCLNWATPSHKAITTGQKEYLAPLTPTLLPFLSPKQLITSDMHRVRSILFQFLTKKTPDRSTQVLQSHLLHPFPHFYSIHLQNCRHMQHVSFIKHLCLHCLWDTLFPPYTLGLFIPLRSEKQESRVLSICQIKTKSPLEHTYIKKQQKGGSGTQKKQDRTRS